MVRSLQTARSAMDTQSERFAVLANATEGRGFFVVRAESGNRLMRAGTFTRRSHGNLGTHASMPVVGSDGRPLTLPAGGREIDERGNVGVEGEAGTRFAVPDDAQSNVNSILTLVEMIDALRVYEAAQKAARGVDETVSRAVNGVGRPPGAYPRATR
jgi:flagellar basal-body rod protein FlgF